MGSAVDPATGENVAVQVLLVEDDVLIVSSLSEALRGQGFDVRHVTRAGRPSPPPPADVVLLDLGLPDMDGYDVCRAYPGGSTVPIIVITARGEELDRVLGLELGADDYVVKPFGFRELVARMRAVCGARRPRRSPARPTPSCRRRAGARPAADRPPHPAGDPRSDGAARWSSPPKEFELLAYLADDPGAVRTRTEILEHVWDANWFGPTKTVDAHVAGIRKKLGDQRWIEAVRGVGFRLEVPPATRQP